MRAEFSLRGNNHQNPEPNDFENMWSTCFAPVRKACTLYTLRITSRHYYKIIKNNGKKDEFLPLSEIFRQFFLAD